MLEKNKPSPVYKVVISFNGDSSRTFYASSYAKCIREIELLSDKLFDFVFELTEQKLETNEIFTSGPYTEISRVNVFDVGFDSDALTKFHIFRVNVI